MAALSRHGFAVTTLAAGFAASVRPVTAATITTDNEGVEEGPVQTPVGAGQIPPTGRSRRVPAGRSRSCSWCRRFSASTSTFRMSAGGSRGLYGAADQGIPVETVEQMKAALGRAGEPSEIVVYPDTPHAFHAEYRPSYREAAAKDGWRRCLAWMRQHGVA